MTNSCRGWQQIIEAAYDQMGCSICAQCQTLSSDMLKSKKEALATTSACERFKDYLIGKEFSIP